MNAAEAKAAGLENNAFSLATAIGSEGHCEPASRICRDGHHLGTMFSWDGREWIVVDLENKKFLGTYDRLAVVTLNPDDDESQADRGLNQSSLGCDLECPSGEWVIDADEIEQLQEIYGDNLIVLWEQA